MTGYPKNLRNAAIRRSRSRNKASRDQPLEALVCQLFAMVCAVQSLVRWYCEVKLPEAYWYRTREGYQGARERLGRSLLPAQKQLRYISFALLPSHHPQRNKDALCDDEPAEHRYQDPWFFSSRREPLSSKSTLQKVTVLGSEVPVSARGANVQTYISRQRGATDDRLGRDEKQLLGMGDGTTTGNDST